MRLPDHDVTAFLHYSSAFTSKPDFVVRTHLMYLCKTLQSQVGDGLGTGEATPPVGVCHVYIGPAQSALCSFRDASQLSPDAREGFTSWNKVVSILFVKQILTHVSPATTTCHLPHSVVVPSATFAPFGGITFSLV
jgi:hypothetical protein